MVTRSQAETEDNPGVEITQPDWKEWAATDNKW